MMAAMAGVDVVDAAFDSMAGLTSQPALNSTVAALEFSERATGMDIDGLQQISTYWGAVRPVYEDYESELKSGTAEIYKYEIPGGQYSNLRPQVASFGLEHKFQDVKEMYIKVNEMLGDIIKVTPSSKAVGDMAIFMVQNDLTPENIYEKAAGMDFPDSIVSYFEGMMGQPEGGFPEKLRDLVLKGKKPITCRPGELLPDEDFDAIKAELKSKFDIEPTDQDAISYALYPKVFEDYLTAMKKKAVSSAMWTATSSSTALWKGPSVRLRFPRGKILVIKLVEIKDADEDGNRELTFQVNGLMRQILIKDKAAVTKASSSRSSWRIRTAIWKSEQIFRATSSRFSSRKGKRSLQDSRLRSSRR